MSVPVRATLMAWFLLMARKLTRGHKPVEMTWSDVRQWLGKVAIVAAAVVEDGRENTEAEKCHSWKIVTFLPAPAPVC